MVRPAPVAASSSRSVDRVSDTTDRPAVEPSTFSNTTPAERLRRAFSSRAAFLEALRWERLRLWLGAMVAGALLMAGIIGIVGWNLIRQTPSWWRASVVADPAAAEAVEHGIVSQLSMIRPTDPSLPADSAMWRSEIWRVSLQEADANSWLGSRLKLWMGNQDVRWPKDVVSIQTDFAAGVIRVGVNLTIEGRQQVVWAEVEPVVDENGSLWMPARRIEIGNMPLPPKVIISWLRKGSDSPLGAQISSLPESRALFDALLGEKPLVADAYIRLDGGRRVRVLKMSPVDGRLELTCRTERPESVKPEGAR